VIISDFSISLIIPTRDDLSPLIEVIEGVNHQDYLPKEIIIVDTSLKDEIYEYIKNHKNKIPINYFRERNAYPGRARNIGVNKAKEEWIAFLDSKTVPKKYWLKSNIAKIIKSDFNIIFGFTEYIPKTFKQKIIRAATFGSIGHETTPGTLLKRNDFLNHCEFNEKARAGEDLEWRNRIKKNALFKVDNINEITLSYYSLPNNILSIVYKYLVYSFHSAYLDIQQNIKELYLTILLIFTAIIIPQWNLLLDGFNKHPLYVPNITKIYISLLIIILILSSLWRYLFLKKIFSSFFITSLKITVVILFFIAIINWEKTFGKWIKFNIWEIQHITKIFFFCIVLVSLFSRGLFLPLKRKINHNFLFPFNWILIGFVGLLIDVVKAPGYLLGAVLSPFYHFEFFKIKKKTYTKDYLKENKYQTKKLLIICPYPINTAPGQRLKYEQYFNFLENNGYQIEVSPFFSLNTYFILQKDGFYFMKTVAVVIGYIKRIFLLFSLKKFDGVYIFLHVVPFTNIIIERLIVKFARKVIYDIDDLVFLLKTSEVNWIASYLKSSEKYFYLMKKANYVITCTPYLNQIAKKHNSRTIDISSTVNTEKYFLKSFKHANKQLVIGWSGSYSTGPYLQLIEDIIQYAVPKYNLKLLVIGAQKKFINGVEHELIPWNAETEVEDLKRIDIGLYPLPKEEWVYGKSGLKAIQFMALGIPIVASAIGANYRVIDHGVNGFLAKNKNEWKNFIKILCENHFKRIEMGKKAREKVIKHFSVNANKNKYLKVFDYTFRNITN